MIGIPFSLYAVNHREPATIPVHYDPRLFEQFSVEPEHHEQTEQTETVVIYEMAPDDLDLEYYYDSLELLALCRESGVIWQKAGDRCDPESGGQSKLS